MKHYTIHERRDEVRRIAGSHQATQRYVVIPNDAPAYRHAGPWGIYDIDFCQWVNFRATEAEAEALRDQIEAA